MSKKNILLTGGGSLGPVTPLFAVVDELGKEYTYSLIGTYTGIERAFVADNYPEIKYKAIVSGKLRRYISIRTLFSPFGIAVGFFQSFIYLTMNRPAVVITAGGFVSVPVIIAAWLLRIPIIVLQLDIVIGLANKIMAYFASYIDITFKQHRSYFIGENVVYTGMPVRSGIDSGDSSLAIKEYSLNSTYPTLLVIGGGTGALFFNELIERVYKKLTERMNVILVTGVGKAPRKHGIYAGDKGTYVVEELLGDRYKDVLACADVVLTRAGLGTTYELLYKNKPMVVVPIPHSQQEANALYYKEKNAGFVYNQNELSSDTFPALMKDIIDNKKRLNSVIAHGESLVKKDAASIIAKQIRSLT